MGGDNIQKVQTSVGLCGFSAHSQWYEKSTEPSEKSKKLMKCIFAFLSGHKQKALVSHRPRYYGTSLETGILESPMRRQCAWIV